MNKKGFNRFVKATTAVFVSAGVLFGSMACVGGLSERFYGSYASMSQIDEIATALDCDFTYWQNNHFRMKHNEDEPIYVVITNQFTDFEREEIVAALDYVFGVIEGINPKYRYHIVSPDEPAEKLINKTSLRIGVQEVIENADAIQRADDKSVLSYVTGKGDFAQHNTILFNPNYLDSKDARYTLRAVAAHEAFHCFGLNDVYCTVNGVYYGNSFMNPFVDIDGLVMITPNDLKALIAVYTEKFENQEEKIQYIEDMKVLVDEYSQEYYEAHTANMRESLKLRNYSQSRIEQIMSPVEQNVELEFLPDANVKSTKKIAIKVSEQGYVISTYGADGKLIDEDTGKVYFADGLVYLQDVVLDKFMNDKESHLDLNIRKDSLTGKYGLRDLGGITLSLSGYQPNEINNENQPN